MHLQKRINESATQSAVICTRKCKNVIWYGVLTTQNQVNQQSFTTQKRTGVNYCRSEPGHAQQI